jgi:DMSO/TMAO reductase YedYZ molybdopterin-dependent catalytic subunit
MPTQRRIVTAEPENSETPLERAGSWVTPTRLFFVRNHFPVPEVKLDTWRLRIEGCVERPRAWSLEELAALPERTVHATMECAGNGRSFLLEPQHGVQWGSGAIGHAEWTGVPLRFVLEKSGLRPETKEILFEGLDSGRESDHAEPLTFARSLPIEKALERDTLLVTRMNGEPLEPIHGDPLRLIVPGWYGVASVKWLGRIEAINYAYKGYYQSRKYTVQYRTATGELETVVIGPMRVKSEIIRPQAGEALGLGTNRLFGIAWAGEESVVRVEISTDGGRNWNDAELLGPTAAYSWTMWEYLWEVATPGRYTLLTRATSKGGQSQPATHDPLLGGYLIHFPRPREVVVEAQRRREDQYADLDTLVYDMNAFAEENVRRALDVELEVWAGAGI